MTEYAATFKTLTPELEQGIRAMYADSRHSQREVADHFNVAPSTVKWVSRKYHIERPRGGLGPRRNRLAHEDFQQTARLYERGMSTGQIARVLGMTSWPVLRRLKTAGVATRSLSEAQRLRDQTEPYERSPPRRYIPRDELERTVRMYRDGMSLSQIGRVMGLSKNTVSYRLRKMGVEPRTIKEARRLRDDRS